MCAMLSDAVVVGLSAAAATVLTAALTFAVAWVDRRSKRRSADATVVAAEASDKAAEAATIAAGAAAEEARAQMHTAVVAEREQASADWARYTEAQQRWNERLQDDINKNAQRIADTELRFLEAEERAHASEVLYRKALIYLRKLILWIHQQQLPDKDYPLPPPELDVEDP